MTYKVLHDLNLVDEITGMGHSGFLDDLDGSLLVAVFMGAYHHTSVTTGTYDLVLVKVVVLCDALTFGRLRKVVFFYDHVCGLHWVS